MASFALKGLPKIPKHPTFSPIHGFHSRILHEFRPKMLRFLRKVAVFAPCLPLHDGFSSLPSGMGNCNVFYKMNPNAFRFFRKEETVLNTERKWEKRKTYVLYPDGKPLEVKNWEIVIASFSEWLPVL